MVLLHLRIGLYVIPKRTSQDLEGPWRLVPPTKGEHLEQTQTSWPTLNLHEGEAPGPHMVG